MKMSRLFVIFCCSLFLLLPFCSHAQQEWEWVTTIRSLFGNAQTATTLDHDGNIVICGRSTDSTLVGDQLFVHTPRSYFIAKFSTQGLVLWYKPISVLEEAPFPDIKCDKDNNILLIVGSNVFKFFPSGDTVWTRIISGSSSNVIIRQRIAVRSGDNSIVLCGTFQNQLTFDGSVIANSNAYSYAFFLLLDENGQLRRHSIIGRTRGSVGISNFVIGPENRMFVSGGMNDTAFFGDSLIVASQQGDFIAYFDSSFTLRWLQHGNGLGKAIAIDSTGLCYASRSVPTNAPLNVLLFDSLGTQLSTIKTTKEGTLYDLAVDRSQNLYAAIGVIESEENMRDLYFAKFDNQGNEQWLRHIGGSLDEASGTINVSENGDVYASGLYASANLDLPPFSIGKLGSESYIDNIFVGKIVNNNMSVFSSPALIGNIRVVSSDKRIYLYLPDDIKTPATLSLMTGLARVVHRYAAHELLRDNGAISIPLKTIASGLYFLGADFNGISMALPFVIVR